MPDFEPPDDDLDIWLPIVEDLPRSVPESDKPRWTLRRIIFLLLILITLIAFLAYILYTSGLLFPTQPPQPPPATQPFQVI